MFKNVRTHWRMVALISIPLFLLFSFVPATFAASQSHPATSPSFKPRYLALGDSLAFGFQPNLDFHHGYADYLSKDLSGNDGFMPVANMGCNGETSTTMLNGQCPYPTIRKYPYTGSQFEAALDYLHTYRGQVGLITLDIGANDTNGDLNLSNCKIDQKKFMTALATIDTNLTQVILPGLHDALMVNGHMTGQLILTNYYDPYQNLCPNTVPNTQLLNQHLVHDVTGYGKIINIFGPFGGAKAPNEDLCDFTWICHKVQDIHATDPGYSLIASIFESTFEE